MRSALHEAASGLPRFYLPPTSTPACASRVGDARCTGFPPRRQDFRAASDAIGAPDSTTCAPPDSSGATMKLGAILTAVISSLMLAALAFADASPTANKWRIELSGQALTTGELVFRVTPRQGDATDV